ncbi:MAG: hypothetical protein HYV63_09290 [Candidatus Schekmanbacteria bacterium]|nr:hypothetical protein [Candidatus Schekmanbacteria bacterium]
MRRFSSTAGPCRPDICYMLPAERRIPEVRQLIDRAQCSVLRQLRAGFREWPARFPQSVALIGRRDVRDYGRAPVMAPAEAGATNRAAAGTASLFNVKVESITLAGDTVPSVESLEERPIVTRAVGCAVRMRVKVATPPCSVVVRPVVGVTVHCQVGGRTLAAHSGLRSLVQ